MAITKPDMSIYDGMTEGPWKLFSSVSTNTLSVHDKNDNPKRPIVNWCGFDDCGDMSWAEREYNAAAIASLPSLAEYTKKLEIATKALTEYRKHYDE